MGAAAGRGRWYGERGHPGEPPNLPSVSKSTRGGTIMWYDVDGAMLHWQGLGVCRMAEYDKDSRVDV